jgi:hypothetical protein
MIFHIILSFFYANHSFCIINRVDCLTPQNKLQEKRSLANQKNKSRLPKQAPVINEGIKYAFQINQLIDYLSRPNSKNIF